MLQNEDLAQKLEAAIQYMQECLGGIKPDILLVLGSGLNHVAEVVANPVVVPFAKVPHLCESTAEGHVGRFVFGEINGKNVLVMQGRLHGYEGYTAQDVAFPIWIAHKLGAKALFTTNAAGGIAEGLEPGDFCIMSDHINFTGRNPVAGAKVPEVGPRFFSMEGAYDADFRTTALSVAADLGIHAQEGVYLGLLGPSFETPAEIRAFASWGAATVAMSVCEEVIAARQVGMRVLGMSLISNRAAGMGVEELNESNFEQELGRVFTIAGEKAALLIKGIIASMEL